MIWKSLNRRAALASSISAAFAFAGTSLGKLAKAGNPFNPSHVRSKIVPYIHGNPLLITIEHPFFDINSKVTFAEIQEPITGNRLGFWVPVAASSGVPGQCVKNNRITVKFDTANPQLAMPGSVSSPTVLPSFPLTTGGVMFISTNIGSSTANGDPILLDPTPITI